MKKDEFHGLFRDLVDILNIPTKELADRFKTVPGVITRWYNGNAAPDILVRTNIVERLYEEKKRLEQIEFVKSVIRDNLNVVIERPRPWSYSDGYVVKIELDGEVIASDSFHIDECKCNHGA